MNRPLRRYAGFYRPYRGRVAGFVALALLQLLLAAPLPFVVKEVFDSAILEQRVGRLIALAALLLVLQILVSAVGLAAIDTLLRISTEVVRRLRQQIFDKLYALSIRFHETTPISDLHDRVVHETERVELMTRNGFAVATPSVIFAVGILVVLAVVNLQLFLISFAFVPIIYFANRATRRLLRQASRAHHGAVERLSEDTFGALRTMQQTRLLGAEFEARARQDETLGRALTAAHRLGLARRTHLGINRVVIGVWVVLVLTIGGAGVINGSITLGELFSFYAGLALLRQPLDSLVLAVPTIVAGREALTRVFELLDVDDARPYHGERQVVIDGHLSIEHVTFEYEQGNPVLLDASLNLRPGEIIALMGPNGSGKTTMARLIVGFYKPASGRISMDGVDYVDLDMTHLRRQFGVVTQDPVMVPGTVRDNITYGRPDVTDDEVQRAIEQAGAGMLLNGLEHGLDTRAYENGPLLSGGQLQRVALARAMLGQPRLLILDEPSNHLDVEGVEGFLAGLRARGETPATILITHQQEVAAMADSVYHVENGRLIRVVESPMFDRRGDATPA